MDTIALIENNFQVNVQNGDNELRLLNSWTSFFDDNYLYFEKWISEINTMNGKLKDFEHKNFDVNSIQTMIFYVQQCINHFDNLSSFISVMDDKFKLLKGNLSQFQANLRDRQARIKSIEKGNFYTFPLLCK